MTNSVPFRSASAELESFSVNLVLPPHSLRQFSRTLRHLRLTGLASTSLNHHLDPFPFLTHLTLDFLPLPLPSFRTSFPALTYLAIRTLPATDLPAPALHPTLAALSALLPPTLTHFATSTYVGRMLCRSLPDHLPHLTIAPTFHLELGNVIERWFADSLEGGGKPGEGRGGLGRLTLLTVEEREEGERGLGWLPPARRARAEAKVEVLERAGCKVEFK